MAALARWGTVVRMQNKLLSLFMALCVASIGCTVETPRAHDDEPAGEDSDSGTPPPADTVEVALSRQLIPWSADVAAVAVYESETALVVVVENLDGDPVARVVMEEATDDLADLSVEFADGKAWATADLQNGALMQHGVAGITADQLEQRASAIVETVQAQLEEGPWLDCVLSVLDAVISCIPAVGVLVVCPSKIKTAVCKCLQAAKKKKKCADGQG